MVAVNSTRSYRLSLVPKVMSVENRMEIAAMVNENLKCNVKRMGMGLGLGLSLFLLLANVAVPQERTFFFQGTAILPLLCR